MWEPSIMRIPEECWKHFFTDYITLSRILVYAWFYELTNEAGLRETATFINALMMELPVRTTSTIIWLFFGKQLSHSRTLLCSASCHKSQKLTLVTYRYRSTTPRVFLAFKWCDVLGLRTGLRLFFLQLYNEYHYHYLLVCSMC